MFTLIKTPFWAPLVPHGPTPDVDWTCSWCNLPFAHGNLSFEDLHMQMNSLSDRQWKVTTLQMSYMVMTSL